MVLAEKMNQSIRIQKGNWPSSVEVHFISGTSIFINVTTNVLGIKSFPFYQHMQTTPVLDFINCSRT